MHARQKLKERYGSMFDVGRTMRDTLSKWQKVHGGDAQALQKYADYLQQCVSGMQEQELKTLNDPQINKQLCEKLPEWIKRKWAGKVYQTKKSEQRCPRFDEIACFITKKNCNPYPCVTTKHQTVHHRKNVCIHKQTTKIKVVNLKFLSGHSLQQL
ncbi:hypothetical protein EB796_002187 [Bugula neritina]|uniref:Uncharacterized protein n=1 Tax=Bugula neritina TaxID=10212 RepID=A0A7J7KMW2_BUGNE|nr:hypothetical protein EB796_002187 [Bugula neritina]